MKNPTEKDFEHGKVTTCDCCDRFAVHCLLFDCKWVCAKCFPWFLQVQAGSRKEVHHHEAPYVPPVVQSLKHDRFHLPRRLRDR